MGDRQTTIERVITGGMLGTLAGTIRALMDSKEPPKVRIKNLFAGILTSILVSFILRNSNWNELVKEIFISCCSAFISVYWPILEKYIKKLVIKKAKDVVSDSGDN